MTASECKAVIEMCARVCDQIAIAPHNLLDRCDYVAKDCADAIRSLLIKSDAAALPHQQPPQEDE